MAHERAQALTQGVLGADPDPFRLADIDAAAVADDPALLFDEAAALSMTGGRRVVRLQGAGDGMTAAFAPLLEARAAGAIADESLVIAEAAALGKGSSLRQLFEGAKAGAALACYGDEDDGLESLIGGVLGTAGHATDADAIAWLTTNLGGDRGVTRGELEKLSLYAGAGAPITLSDAEAAIGDSAGLNLDDAALAAAAGDVRALDRALQTARIEGQSPVQVLRALARTLSRLHLAAGLRDAGASPTQAIAVLRPPVFFKQKQGVPAGPRPLDRDRSRPRHGVRAGGRGGVQNHRHSRRRRGGAGRPAHRQRRPAPFARRTLSSVRWTFSLAMLYLTNHFWVESQRRLNLPAQVFLNQFFQNFQSTDRFLYLQS